MFAGRGSAQLGKPGSYRFCWDPKMSVSNIKAVPGSKSRWKSGTPRGLYRDTWYLVITRKDLDQPLLGEILPSFEILPIHSILAFSPLRLVVSGVEEQELVLASCRW